jgi:uncharacterized protein
MTKFKFSSVLIIFILISTAIYAQDTPVAVQNKSAVIEVFGTATISVVPDLMKWTINIQQDNDNLQEAKNRNDASLSKVLNVLREYGVEESKIKTSGISMTKRTYRYGEEKKFSVTNTVWFTLETIAKYDLLTSELIRIEDVYVTNTEMESSKGIETRIQARTNALLAAKEKAVKMAEVLGVSVGKPLLIEEAPANYWYPVQSNVNSMVSESSSTNPTSHFSEGMLSIEARVKVVFEIK